MTKVIEKELEKCSKYFNDFPGYDKYTQEILYKKGSIEEEEQESALKINHLYLIEVQDYIINEPKGFTLSKNWNNGTTPPENILQCQILAIQGKMIKVYSMGSKTGIVWQGFIPLKSIKIIGELRNV